MPVPIRRAVCDDIPPMHSIRMAVTENRLLQGSTLGHQDYRPFLGEDGETWVSELDGSIVGFGAIDLPNASVWALFVAPGCEARGIGKALLHHLQHRARSNGLTVLFLTTSSGTRAEQFYVRQGWAMNGKAANGDIELRYELGEP